jgi:Skp family chaperone for outer membrane proteins
MIKKLNSTSMKKCSLLILTALLSLFSTAQTRGVKIGYIDMEYILEKVPDYAEAKSQLEAKAQKWKQEIEEKKIEIAKLKESLKTEKVLLTKELIEEREEEISFVETELLNYQQKRFGPNGDLVLQKAVLVKPIQDQVFNAVQDIAEVKKYDYILDKSSDLTILFAAKRFDISDRVVSALTRAEKREQMSKKQLKLEEERERKQDLIDDNPELSERQKANEQKKLERDKNLEDRKLAVEEKKKAFEARRQKLLDERNNKKNGTVSDNDTKDTTDGAKNNQDAETKKLEREDKIAKAQEAKTKTLEERKKLIEDRKKATEDKRLKAIADREALRKAKEEELKKNKEENSKP